SDAFVSNLQNLLEKTSINHLDFTIVQSSDFSEINRMIANYKAVIVSEEREILVRQMVSESQEVITFYYEIDRGSLNQVLMKLVSQAL
ncbi:MAG: transcriptional regulator, GntR family, partial [Sporomusa sp.]|nr:transcriptional regulator, GntR family [Sporomusa sp.]